MAAEYEELHGAWGRDVNYRPQRHRTRDLFSSDRALLAVVGEARLPVLDVSSNGLCLLVDGAEESYPVGARLQLDLHVHGATTQRLSAHVARVEARGSKLRLGVHVLGAFVDVDEAMRQDRAHALDCGLRDGPGDRLQGVPENFRVAVSDMAFLLGYYRTRLLPHEAAARSAGEEAVQALADQTYKALAPRYDRLRRAAARAIAPHLSDMDVVRAAKEYTETVLTPLVLDAPMPERAYRKPLGYPGDYRVMVYYYDDAYEGQTAYAKAVHRIFVQHPLSAGVPTRRDYVVSRMREHLTEVESRSDATGGAYRVLSLGCGPAREVSSFAQEQRVWRTPVEFQLIDQDAQALEEAHKNATRALAPADGPASVSCLNLSFTQLLANPQLLHRHGQQDFVYCTGLFDYLKDPVASHLLSTLYSTLKPGGQLLVGNAAGPNDAFFCPEFVLDWSLIYRTDEDMRRLTAALPAVSKPVVELELGGAYFFVRARRPVGDTHT